MGVGHYENFPVASVLLPRAMRPHVAALYAFARTADDFADPRNNPYALAQAFMYRPRWTARHFNAQRDLIRAMCLDSGDELRSAWQTIVRGGGPARQPVAMELLQRMPVTWASATRQKDRLTYLREWTDSFRQNYRRAQEAVRP